MSLGFLCLYFQRMHCVDFVENALFKSSDDVYWSPLPSSLLDWLSMDKSDSDGFFSSRLVCRTSDRSYNSTDSSLAYSYNTIWHVLLMIKFNMHVFCWNTSIITPCACARGKVIGSVVIVIVVVDTKITWSQHLGTWVTCKCNECVKCGEKLAS